MPAYPRLISDGARKLRALRTRLDAEDGLTIVEVAVTGLMVGLISLSLIGLDAAGKTASDQRRRAQAFQVAQADQERIKGLSADQIANLDQTRTITLDGDTYTVTSTGQFLSSAADSASCSTSAAAADYAKVISTVNWTANARSPVVVQSVVTPRAGGSLLAQTVDQNAAAISGARRQRQRRRPEHRRGAPLRDHRRRRLHDLRRAARRRLRARPGAGGLRRLRRRLPHPSATVTTTAGNTTTYKFTLGRAGAISANFRTTIGGTTLTGQEAPSLSW